MTGTKPLSSLDTTLVWLTPDELTSVPLRTARDWWRDLCGSRRFPAREEMNPRDMGHILPYMSLIKVIDGGEDFEHRIVGDAMVQAFSVSIQNRRFSDIAKEAPELIERSLRMFRKVVSTGAPICWHLQTGFDGAHMVFTESEVLLLPLGKSEDIVDHVVGFGSCERHVKPPRHGDLTHP